MSAEIINTGRDYIAAQIGNSNPVNISEFVFAYISGLDDTDPVDMDEAMPDVGDIVHTHTVDASGYVDADKVVYSAILNTTIGNFTFNWVGLKASDGTLVAVRYVPDTLKTKTVGTTAGNSLTRNFMLAFVDAKATTNISVDAATWQIDFSASLLNYHNQISAALADGLGDYCLDDGSSAHSFLVTQTSPNTADVELGQALVQGVWIDAGTGVENLYGTDGKQVYLDVWLVNGEAQYEITTSNTSLGNYTDAQGREHKLLKIAAINIFGVVTDVRPVKLPDANVQSLALKTTELRVHEQNMLSNQQHHLFGANYNVLSAGYPLLNIDYKADSDGVYDIDVGLDLNFSAGAEVSLYWELTQNTNNDNAGFTGDCFPIIFSNDGSTLPIFNAPYIGSASNAEVISDLSLSAGRHFLSFKGLIRYNFSGMQDCNLKLMLKPNANNKITVASGHARSSLVAATLSAIL